MYEMKFDDSLITPLLKNNKKTTWRLLSDTAVSELEPGNRFYALDTDGNKHAELEVKWIKLTKISFITDEDQYYHKKYSSVGEIVEEMREYYPDEDITVGTSIAVIRFQLINEYN